MSLKFLKRFLFLAFIVVAFTSCQSFKKIGGSGGDNSSSADQHRSGDSRPSGNTGERATFKFSSPCGEEGECQKPTEEKETEEDLRYSLPSKK
jgi:hypothetical protein